MRALFHLGRPPHFRSGRAALCRVQRSSLLIFLDFFLGVFLRYFSNTWRLYRPVKNRISAVGSGLRPRVGRNSPVANDDNAQASHAFSGFCPVGPAHARTNHAANPLALQQTPSTLFHSPPYHEKTQTKPRITRFFFCFSRFQPCPAFTAPNSLAGLGSRRCLRRLWQRRPPHLLRRLRKRVPF